MHLPIPTYRQLLKAPGLLFALTLPQALAPAAAQDPPSLRVGTLPKDFRLNGVLDETAWQQANKIDGLTTTVPQEGGRPSSPTTVRVFFKINNPLKSKG